jgi:hypothetical protein
MSGFLAGWEQKVIAITFRNLSSLKNLTSTAVILSFIYNRHKPANTTDNNALDI